MQTLCPNTVPFTGFGDQDLDMFEGEGDTSQPSLVWVPHATPQAAMTGLGKPAEAQA